MIQLLKRWKMAWSRSGSLLLSICVAWIATFLDVPLASSGEVPHPAGRLVIYPQSLHPSPRYPAQVSVFWIKPDGTSIDVTQDRRTIGFSFNRLRPSRIETSNRRFDVVLGNLSRSNA